MDRMRASLNRFAAHHNVPKLYHETLTRFWMHQVQQRLDRNLCLAESVHRIQEALPDKKLPLQYYTQETLDSADAKTRRVEPELGRE